MRWDRSHRSSNLEDRRGQRAVGGGGGLPIGSILAVASRFGWKGILVGLLIVVGMMFFNPCSSTEVPQHQVATGPASATEDDLAGFVGFVIDDVNASWKRALPNYRETKLVLFRDAVDSACGTASAAVGPFYCPLDSKVYIDLAFYEQLRRRFGAPGDFAQAYVIAHEVGHHIENLRGELGRGSPDQIALELEADCLAGAWAKGASERGLLEVGDIDEALDAAAAIGDDTIQRKTQGRIQPETWTHGSAKQRSTAFRAGLERGATACWR